MLYQPPPMGRHSLGLYVSFPAALVGAPRRHRVEGGRQHAVKVRFTEEEYSQIAERAAAAHVSVQRFLVEGALAPRRQVVVPAALIAELSGLRRLLANLANNVNQIARRLNTTGRPDGSVSAVAEALTRTLGRLDTVVAWLGSPPRPGQPSERTTAPRT
jgi:uncharacterized protein (DUF1778 family)